ncbi:hypothetical protein M440DRAFT_1391883 [Trichoderma longibrachiatum ATCC 18648]|uniref:Ubiquitin-like protease family profile domain-containing protein n=1 Tax=Trichoderma longibrachiatum ATCC 18648 TaxID=983965 RepID=A0A2T4C4A4_TRILO|nr:hypothetical protein M440DRAFT_1391883 [Trichoderma longibrachiatum ATCC 18648]
MPFRQRMARHFGDSVCRLQRLTYTLLRPFAHTRFCHSLLRDARMLTSLDRQLAPEKAYLSYYDVLLTVEDIKSLKEGLPLQQQALSEIVKRPIRFVNLDDSPQQENGSDCGVFVCLLMRHLLVKRLLVANAREKVSMSMAGKMVDSNGGRKEMLRIIENLRKEGEHFQKLLHEPGRQGDGSTEQLLTPASTPPDPKKPAVLADDAKTIQAKGGAAKKTTNSKTRALKAVASIKGVASGAVALTKAVAPGLVASKTASKSVVSKTDASKAVKSSLSISKTVATKAVASQTVASKPVASKTVAQPDRRASAKAPGKGQIQTPTTAKRPAKTTPSKSSSPKVTKTTKATPSRSITPTGKPHQRARGTRTPVVRMVRIQPPPRDPNKPTMLEIKFASNKGLPKKAPTPTPKKPAAAPIKDRGLRAALE